MKKKTIGIVLIVIALLAVMAGMYAVYRHFSPKAQTGEKHIALTIAFDDGSKKEYEVDTNAAYLREALASVAEISGTESAEYGYTLYTVDGVTADFNKGSAYWAIYVNGEYGMYSLAEQPVADGDHYTIAYETY